MFNLKGLLPRGIRHKIIRRKFQDMALSHPTLKVQVHLSLEVRSFVALIDGKPAGELSVHAGENGELAIEKIAHLRVFRSHDIAIIEIAKFKVVDEFKAHREAILIGLYDCVCDYVRRNLMADMIVVSASRGEADLFESLLGFERLRPARGFYAWTVGIYAPLPQEGTHNIINWTLDRPSTVVPGNDSKKRLEPEADC